MPMDEKQKIIILGVLGAALVGVGIFQVIPKGAPAPEPTPVENTDKTPGLISGDPNDLTSPTPVPPVEPKKNPALAFPLNRRDPFAIPPDTVRRIAKLDPANTPPPIKLDDIRGLGNKPKPIKGTINVGTEPPPSTEPVEVVHAPFNWHVVGVVLGRVPAVLLADGAGNQKLVAQGGAIDGDSFVKSVGLNEVVVTYFGKTQSLPVGEEKNNNAQ